MNNIAILVAVSSLLVSATPIKKAKKVTKKTVPAQVLTKQAAAVTPAYGTVPAGLPNKLTMGLFEDTGVTWMKNSGTPWDIRYRYLTYGWSNNWGYGPTDGSFAGEFFAESGAQGFIPAIAYYELYDVGQAGLSTYTKLKSASTMQTYFNDFKLLMQQAKTFNKPVIVMVEADSTGYLQGEIGNPQAYAAIADTGIPELVAIPNTVGGWGLAFLQLRKAVGATKVILGLHVSGWATGQDLFYFDTGVDLNTAVQTTYNFLQPFGLDNNNAVGQSYDVLVGDPLDRDSDYYVLVRGEARWWDASDTAGVNTKSFNRYAEWLRLWNATAQKRWIIWQVPIGNSNHKNVCNDGSARAGYKDNRTEYFLSSGNGAHLEKWVSNGVISFLFGMGADCQSSYENDYDSTGQLFLNSRAKAFYAAGGLSLGTGSTVDAGVDAGTDAGVVDSGVRDAGVDAGRPDSGTPDAGTGTGDVAQFNFETGLQGFYTTGKVLTGVSLTNSVVYAGKGSLAVAISGKSKGLQQVLVDNPVIPAGVTLNFRVYVPSGTPISSVQVFAQESSATGWRWNANWVDANVIAKNSWVTLSVPLPKDASAIQSMGVEFNVNKLATGTVYIDSIGWGSGVADGGTGVDSGVRDAGVDAGAVDSGVTDSGIRDSGTPDAGVVDSGTVDAGKVDGGLTKNVKIQAIGDSITEGVNGGYRCPLFNSLTALGYTVDMVGSLNDQYANCTDKDHDGHAGWSIGDIACQGSNGGGCVNTWVPTYKPDIITLMIGTNNVAWWLANTAVEVAAEHDALITQIQGLAPNAWIIVGTIPPESSSVVQIVNIDRAVLVNQFNAAVKANVQARVMAGQKVRLADVNSVLTLSDLYDGIHPAEAANSKIANVWLNAIQPLLP